MSWLTSLFKRKIQTEEDRKDYIEYSELPNYINNFVQPKEKELDELFKQLEEKISELDNALTQLKTAKITEMNPKIVNVILDNRNSYIKHTKIFMETIKLPEELSFSKTKQFCYEFEQTLKDFTEKSTKSFHVAKNLIGDELENVAKKIRELEDYIKEIKLFLHEENADKIIEIRKQTEELFNTVQIKKNYQVEIDSLKQQFAQLEFSQSKMLEEISEISKTEEFEKLNNLKEENQSLQDRIEKLKSDALALFLPLDKSLRKFNKLSPEEVIQDYINNPLKALKQDKDFKIFNILKQIEAALIDDQLDIKEEKKDKTLESIKNISEESLKNLLSEYISLINEQQSIKEKLSINKIEETLTVLNEKLNSMTHKKNSLQNEINELEKKKPMNIEDISQNLTKKIKDITEKEVVIQTKDI